MKKLVEKKCHNDKRSYDQQIHTYISTLKAWK